MSIKIADSKGRIMLGSRFAGQMVLIDDSNPEEIVITPAVAIPAREAWLYKNEKALQMVRRGLDQAENGQFSENTPDLASDSALVDQLKDEPTQVAMFNLKWTVEADATYSLLKAKAETALALRQKKIKGKTTKDEGLFKQVHKAISLLRENPKHPGLRTHEYSSIANPYDKKKKVFEAYAQNQTPGAYRVFWCYGKKKQEITILAITPHP